MWHVKSSELTHLITQSLCPLTNTVSFSPPPSNYHSIYSVSLIFFHSTCDTAQYLSFCFISLNIMPLRFIHVIANGRISSFYGPLCILHHVSFIHSSVNSHLGCFYILASNCILGHLLQRSENFFSCMFRAWTFAQPKPRNYLNIHQWYHTTKYNSATVRIWLQIQAKMWMTLNWEKNLKRAHTVWFLLHSIHEVRDPEKISGCQRDGGGDGCGYKGVAGGSFMVTAQFGLNCGQNSTQLHTHR